MGDERAKVLIVDDKRENLFAMEVLLKQLDIAIYKAESGNEALMLMLQHEFALVLLDVQMPGMDGFEVASIMQDSELTRNIPIIFVTAISKEEKHVFKGYGSGAVDYIFKPLNPDILRSKVCVFVNLYEARVKCIEMEQEIQKARNFEAISIFSGGVAHDFNNLLTAILGNIELVELLVSANEKARSTLNEAKNATLRARDLTRKLMEFSRGESLSVKETMLGALIREAAGLVFTDPEVQFDCDISDDLPLVKINAKQFEKVFYNLFLNAVEAMPGGGAVRVWADRESPGHPDTMNTGVSKYIRVSVKDEGGGIAAKNIPHIFDPYFSTKEKGPQKGMGLGLSYCYSVLKRHGGDIIVESELGKGATFHLYIPVPAKQIKDRAGHSADVNEPRNKTSGRILIMEDEEIVGNVVIKMLDIIGYEAELAPNGEAALEKYQEGRKTGRPFDIVILDLTVPGKMGGAETLKRLLEIDPQVKAIVSSGYSDDPVMLNYREFGFLGALGKPYRIDELSGELQRILTSEA